MNNYDNEGNGLLFDFPKYKINKKIRLIELFGGIGSQAMALRDIGADFEYYRLVEFDKYAVQAYNAIHNTQHTTHDIRQTHAADLGIVETDKYCYLMTYSFPCTDLSVAGKMQGMSKADWQNGNATRSGLLWEVERILKECDELPQVLLMENVPQVHAEQNRADFESWLNFLRGKGYHNFYKDLNAKDYGIPQNRDRCFCVSILSPDFIEYDFPETVKLESVMKDYLEENVDEKYYINSETAKKLIADLIGCGELKTKEAVYCNYKRIEKYGVDVAKTIMARDCKGFNTGFDTQNGVIEKTKCVGSLAPDEIWGTQPHQQHRVYKGDIALAQPANLPEGSYKYIVAMRGRGNENKQTLEANTSGTTNSLTTVQKDKLVLDIKCCRMVRTDEGKRLRKAYESHEIKCGFNEHRKLEPREDNIINSLTTVEKDNLCLEIKQATKDGVIKYKVGGCYDASYPDSKTRRGRVQNDGDVTPTITAQGGENINYVETEYRIRKLTPRECWRLMGYTDEDFDKAQAVVSNTQLYKQAGNAIVKQVLMAIFKQML
jgi:DNA (cytosine-5)-methyltransferase 1